ncbi:MAG: hypothetical protein VW270_02135 [Candidatus Poseidoniales archaeon]
MKTERVRKKEEIYRRSGMYFVIFDEPLGNEFQLEKNLVGELAQNGCEIIVFRSRQKGEEFTTDMQDWLARGLFYDQSDFVFLPRELSYIRYS